MILLWVLVIAEGFGFAYTLGTWAALEGSENIYMLLMIALALVIAVPSVLLSHEAGVRYHRHQTNKQYKEEWKGEGQPGKYKSASISLIQDQSQDDNELPCTQFANRAHTKIALAPLWGALLWALAVVVLSTTMRFSHLEKQMAQETTGGAVASVSGASGNPFAAPAELAAPQIEADKTAEKDIKHSELFEGGAAFIMLAILYLATQGVGAAVAAKGAFSGAQSESAYNSNYGFETYDDFLRQYEPIAQIAQARLQTLQQRLGEKQSNMALKLHQSFGDYLVSESNKGQERKANKMAKSVVTAPAVATAEPAPIPVTSDTVPVSNSLEIPAVHPSVAQERGSPKKTKFCSECGDSIAVNSKFCGGCGLKFA